MNIAQLTTLLVSTQVSMIMAAPPQAHSQAAKVQKVMSSVKLPKGGFIHLEVLDIYRERRSFLVTCEKELDQKTVDALLQTGVGYQPLKKTQKQSLINYWKTPATDYVVVCEGK